MNNDVNDEEKFSEDPEEQLKIENDILKLKLQAELGADFKGEEELSPDVENLFLKNVLEFEHQFANASSKTVFEILGSPLVEKEADLTDAQVEEALGFLEELMEQKGIAVDYSAEYGSRIKYKFVTEELFYKESGFIDIPGMTTHFIYEEFHPNHILDITNKALHFFSNWEERSFDEYSFDLAAELILEDGTIMPKAAVLQKIHWMFEAYIRFENAAFSIENSSFELNEEGTGLGFAEGEVAYDAVLENGEIQTFKGPFKLYMQYDGRWEMFFFHWPGFNW